MLISLTFPDASLHAHAKGHWRAKSAATRLARQYAFLKAKSLPKPDVLPMIMDYYFYVPDRRKRDAGNMVQSCKAYVDGIVDAGLLRGDDWMSLSIGIVSVEVDRKFPRVDLVLR